MIEKEKSSKMSTGNGKGKRCMKIVQKVINVGENVLEVEQREE